MNLPLKCSESMLKAQTTFITDIVSRTKWSVKFPSGARTMQMTCLARSLMRIIWNAHILLEQFSRIVSLISVNIIIYWPACLIQKNPFREYRESTTQIIYSISLSRRDFETLLSDGQPRKEFYRWTHAWHNLQPSWNLEILLVWRITG